MGNELSKIMKLIDESIEQHKAYCYCKGCNERQCGNCYGKDSLKAMKEIIKKEFA